MLSHQFDFDDDDEDDAVTAFGIAPGGFEIDGDSVVFGVALGGVGDLLLLFGSSWEEPSASG